MGTDLDLIADDLKQRDRFDTGGPAGRVAVDKARDDAQEARRQVVSGPVVEFQRVGDEEAVGF